MTNQHFGVKSRPLFILVTLGLSTACLPLVYQGNPRKEAQTFIDRYFVHYSGGQQFMDDIMDQTRVENQSSLTLLIEGAISSNLRTKVVGTIKVQKIILTPFDFLY